MRDQTCGLLSAALVAGLLSLAGSPVSAATPSPADIAVYGEQPATFWDGVTPFPASGSAFQYQQDSNDPVTHLKFTAVPGFENGLGRFPYRLAGFGKYMLVGNAQNTSVGGRSTDLRIGVFDSETKQYCNLIVDPNVAASVPQIVTGNPNAPKSRILMAPGTTSGLGGADAFGYIQADLSVANPCSWPAVFVSASQLNAGFAPADQLCPNNTCTFDAVALLGHEDVPGDPFGRDYVALGDYFSRHMAVIRVDATGIAVAAIYDIPLFATPNSGGACYSSGPARLPSTDFQLPDARPANDWRLFFSFDAFIATAYSSTPPASCASPYPYCPLDIAGDGVQGADCPGSGTCAQSYCSKPFLGTSYIACTTTANCSNVFGSDLGPCQNTCLLKSPLFTCKTSTGGGSHRQCIPTDTCNPAQGRTCPTGETCSSSAPCIVGPSQEYRFDKTLNTITPTSPMFFYSSGGFGGPAGPTPTGPVYDSDRGVWTSQPTGTLGLYRTKLNTDNCTVSGQTVHVPTGEHCYFSAAPDPTVSVIVPADATLSFEPTLALPYLVATTQVGTAMYIADSGSLQYAQKYNGAWFPVSDTSYKVGFAYAPPGLSLTDPLASSSLPANPKRCSVSLFGCNTDADCAPSGGTCTAVSTDNLTPFANVPFLTPGGAPTSLWVTAGYPQPSRPQPVAQTDVFLERIPLGFYLADNLSAVRPSIAWSGARLWLVAEHNGVLKFRVRDQGIWSGWYPLPTNMTTAGGASAIFFNGTVELFGRSSSGTVITTQLTSAINCQPANCTWVNWATVPGSPTTDQEPAAEVQGTIGPFLAVRRQSDGRVLYAHQQSGTWSSWNLASQAVLTDAAPAAAWNPLDGSSGKIWLVVRNQSTGRLHFGTIGGQSGLNFGTWAALPTSGVEPWGTAPQAVWDGTAVRTFASQPAFPNTIWQIANNGSGWSQWRPLLSGGQATYQPAAANINGQIDLVMYWFTAGIQETFLP